MGVVGWLANVTAYMSKRNERVPPHFIITQKISGTSERHFITSHSSQIFPRKFSQTH